MASLNAAMALTTLADVDIELSVDGLARNLHLELVSDVGFVEVSPAVRAEVGQESLVDFVDLFGGRWLSVSLGAVVLTRLASGLLGVWLGLTLSEGSSLAFACAGRRVELPTEAFDLGLKVVDPSL
jgi:hypothetical protein